MKITDTKASFKCELGFPEVSVAGMSLKSEFCGFQKIDENIYSLPGQWGVLTETFLPSLAFSKEAGKKNR